ncbi:MAG: type II toxin-antitoxin system prevent-host-death family antitoxin [Rhodocyclales bacterium]|nr:type II toxin-antitoxin system prevent-host-death family antitoxin [Rhodocyclales bacterium]
MTITTLSSRKFNQDASGAKKAAAKGPVFITDRGRPAHVLLTVEAYRQLTGLHANIIDLLAMPDAAEIEFDPPRLPGDMHRPADFS